VGRLQQIVSLKALGFSLEQIGESLSRDDYDPREVVRLHHGRVKDQARELNQLADRLGALADALDAAETVSADEFLSTIQEMTMVDKYYTPEQLATLQARKAEVGEERIKEVEAEWPRLMAEVQAEMEAGTDPADPKVQGLARRWVGLVSEFTGGDPGIERSLTTMYQKEDQIHGVDVAATRPMDEYIGKAATAAGIRMPGT
jgi:DNA-binding transcriptional MerR regulator